MKWICAVAVGLFLAVAAAQAAPPGALLDVKVQKGRSTKRSGTDYDNKMQRLLFTVTVVNKHPAEGFGRLKATLVVIGKSTTQDRFQVLDRAVSEFDLAARGQHVFEGSEVTLDFDDNAYAKYGYKYEGYIVAFDNAGGERVAIRASKPVFERNADTLIGMQPKSFFDDRFRPVTAD